METVSVAQALFVPSEAVTVYVPTAEISAAQDVYAMVIMPRLAGLATSSAQNKLRALGLSATIERVASPRPAGTIVGQRPIAGVQLRRGMTVTILVSSGPALIDVPDVTGRDENDAQQRLENAGFRTALVDQPVSDLTQDGVVIDETPLKAHKGDTITLTIGRANQP